MMPRDVKCEQYVDWQHDPIPELWLRWIWQPEPRARTPPHASRTPPLWSRRLVTGSCSGRKPQLMHKVRILGPLPVQ